MRARRGPSGLARDERGFALLIVLWISVVLFVLGAEFAQGMRDNAAATKNFADETQSYYLATAAANRTFYRVVRAYNIGRWDQTAAELGLETEETQGEAEALIRADGEWHREEMWGAPVWVRVTDMGGKVSLNAAAENLLRLVLQNLGLEMDAAAALSDAIFDWRDRDENHRLNGAESDYYMKLPRPYPSKNAPFDTLEELLLLKGVTPELYYGGNEDFPIGLVDVFTVFNRYGTLNLRNMRPEVIRAIFNLTDEELLEVQRMQQTPESSLDILRGFLESRLTDPTIGALLETNSANIVMVEAQAKLPDARVPARVAGVIEVEESSEGIAMLRWMDHLPADESLVEGETTEGVS